MFKVILSVLSLCLLLSLFSCKSTNSSTYGGLYFDDDSVPVDRFQYIDVLKVYTLNKPESAENPIDHRYAVAEKQDDGSFILHFASQLNHIPYTTDKLDAYFPKNVRFRTLAVPNKNGTYTIYASKTDVINKRQFLRTNNKSQYRAEDFNIPVGTAINTSGQACNPVNTASYDHSHDILTDECVILSEFCTGKYANTCKLSWDQYYKRFGLPYHIDSINIKKY